MKFFEAESTIFNKIRYLAGRQYQSSKILLRYCTVNINIDTLSNRENLKVPIPIGKQGRLMAPLGQVSDTIPASHVT